MKYDDGLATFADILIGLGWAGRCFIYGVLLVAIVGTAYLVTA